MASSTHLMRVLLLVVALSNSLIANVATVPEDYEYITCEIQPSTRSARHHTHPRIPYISPDCRNPKEIVSDSTNWSGYVAAVGNLAHPTPHTVTKVSGTWIVPNLQASTVDTSCSIWVGIDGSGSNSVEQLGTEHDVQGGQQQHYAWFEMYPQPSSEITGFPVEVGDSISASVTYVPLVGVLPLGNTLFIMQITNNTKKVYTVIPCIATTDMERLCAEWIVEAPYLNGILPLTNFGTVHLSNCTAEINNVTGPINNPSWLNESMNMVTLQGASKAVTSALSADGESFSVTWQHV